MLRSVLLPLTAALPALLFGQIVINEVDYDQPSTDNAEYIEIKNVGTTVYPMQYVAVILVNGAGGTSVIYQTISSPSWPPLAPGDYFVICANASNTPNCDHVAEPASNLVQNGPADAIALVNVATDEVLDIVSYGGDVLGYTEGTGTTAVDVNSVDGRSLNRWPDGTDTNNNDADFQVGCSTPGETNLVDAVLCDVPSSISDPTAATALIVLADPSGDRLLLSFGDGSGGPVTFEVFALNGTLVAHEVLRGNGKGMLSMALPDRAGQLLLVRASTARNQQTRRVVMP